MLVSDAAIRIDKLLWFLRVAKTRSLAQEMVAAGHVRVNGRRIDRASHGVYVDDVVTFPWGSGARAIRIVTIPVRRGPAIEAQSHYIGVDT